MSKQALKNDPCDRQHTRQSRAPSPAPRAPAAILRARHAG
ncbi:hypothetical protein J2126_004003 [Xanthobacter flavus]|nr:hypothetical protein [Xanthobacter flavus]